MRADSSSSPPAGAARAAAPRPVLWVLLLTAAAAVAGTGLLATVLIVAREASPWGSTPASFWPRLLAACVLTVLSLSLRSLRWIFLLRRAETRIPIRDAYIGYLAGFSLLLTPLLVGETAVRAAINRRRGRVPVAATIVVTLWERGADLVALLAIAGVASVLAGRQDSWGRLGLGVALLSLVPPLRRAALRVAVALGTAIARRVEAASAHDWARLGTSRTWLIASLTSVVAWLLPGVGLWLLAGMWPGTALPPAAAQYAYAQSTTAGAVMFAPAGVLVAGQRLLEMWGDGVDAGRVVLIVLGIRLATAGVSTALGLAFALIHLRTLPASSETHFDDIADAYDVQIPEGRRLALLERKTTLMERVVTALAPGRRGLDVGCGQGAYVERLRADGFDVSGIDFSAGQIAFAARRLGDGGLVRVGSVLQIPAPDASYDFAYTINVLHHLPSVEDQRRAFTELFRVLKPGGLLFVHEINTRNVLFRFYMGYVFPSLNCIDEGIERWLLPHQLHRYTAARVVDAHYFTFLPEFVPQGLARWLRPLEAALERSPLRIYSAHYMSVLRKDE